MKAHLCLFLFAAGTLLAPAQAPPALPSLPSLPPPTTNRGAASPPAVAPVTNAARLTNTARTTPPALPASRSAPPALPHSALTRPAGPAGVSPLPTPPALVPPAPAPSTPPPAPANPQAGTGNDLIQIIDVKEMPIEQFLDSIYAMYSRRTVLRSAGIAPLLKSTVSFRMQSPMHRSELIVAMDTLLALNNITMIPVGDKLVSAVPNATVTTEGAAFFKGNPESAPEGAQFMTHIAQLKYALPTEVAPALQQFAKVPNGIVPIDSSRVIILRDYSANVKRMMEVIDQVDRVPETDYKFEVIPIRFSKVEDLYYSISSLISGGGGAAPPPTTRATGRGAFGTRPGQFGGMGGVGGMMGSPGAYGAQGAYGQPGVAGPMGGIGQPGATIGGAGAARNTFQQRLQQIVNRAAGPQGEVQLLTEAKIVPDERSNSLVVFANKRDLNMLTNIISKLDVALAQVLIEGIIMEVSLNDSSSLGVSFLQQPKQAGRFVGGGGANNGPTVIDPSSLLSGATNGLANLASGFSYFGKWGNDLDVALTAIAQDNTINVISRPRIQTSHAVPAEFFVGDTVPYVTATYNYGGLYGGVLPQSSYSYMNVGVDLSVTPYITPDGLVTMEINENISQLGTPVTIDGNPVPTTSSRIASATISVHDRDTIILGGFISDTKSKSKAGVPVLKDIPLLGALFRSSNNTAKRTELIVLMRPTVLATPEDAAATAAAEKSRLFGIRQAEKEVEREDLKRQKKARAKHSAFGD